MTEKERYTSVNRENADFLDVESRSLGASAELVALEMARAVTGDLGEALVLPEEAMSLFEEHGGRADNVQLFARFCRHINKSYETEENPLPERVSYVRNPYSDRAFDTFSSIIGSLRVFYAESSKGVCESVYYDETDSCILPFEGSDEGLLLSFRKLMLKYELRVVSVVKIPTGDEGYTSFALLSNAGTDENGNFCELYLPAIGGEDILSVCGVLESLSVVPERMTSVPAKDKPGYDLHLCIKGESQVLRDAVFCLEALYKSCIPLGQYRIYNLERKIFER